MPGVAVGVDRVDEQRGTPLGRSEVWIEAKRIDAAFRADVLEVACELQLPIAVAGQRSQGVANRALAILAAAGRSG